ncbi:MAG: alpha/beta hydrolase [Gammaproteobacteria bacterium]|nr:alpha/beta hydrolase [Gammaproteobacteria bacterium]
MAPRAHRSPVPVLPPAVLRRRLPWLALLLALPALAAEPPVGPATMDVGRITLHRCERGGGWCGSLPRALDPSGAVPGTVPVYFEYYPHSAAGPAAGTLVAAEGGPGSPSTGSRDSYLGLFAPLRATHDVLLMDNRGTGRSGAIECVGLQNAPQLTEALIGECGRTLGRRAPLYSTNLAADDLAELLEALGIARVSLYGDSYGTYFAQVFALRHPLHLRALVLDGAYPLEGPDYGWWLHYAPAVRVKFNRACERSAACRAVPGSSIAHITPALAQLRTAPVEAHVRLTEARTVEFRAGAAQLAEVMYGASPPYATLRETDAAARAFTAGDQTPLLRLMAEAVLALDSRDATRDPKAFSSGLAAAVSCLDLEQIFDMNLPVAARLAERERLIAQRRAQSPEHYAPFTLDEYRAMPLDYTFIDECVRWPQLPGVHLPLVRPPEDYPDLPVLVLSGEMDPITSPADGAAAAARWPAAHHVVIANGLHVNALAHARSACGAQLVQRFLADLTTGDDRCAASAPPMRLVGRFAGRTEELEPAGALEGNAADAGQLRAVSAALLTAEDVITRARDAGSVTLLGLRGGHYTIESAGEGYLIELHGVRWTEDLEVSGRVQWPGRSGTVHAALTLEGAARGTLNAQWPEGVADARASVEGNLSEHRVHAEMPAP